MVRMSFRRVTRWLASGPGLLVVGALFGVLAAALQHAGNPANMGICTAGFIRDIAGALGLHRTPTAQYLRPEIPGLVLGAALSALSFGELKSRVSTAAWIHVALGALTMLGALAFQGCSLRGLLRLAGGDLAGLVGLAGFVVGIAVGVRFLRRGFSFGRSRPGAQVASWTILVVPAGLVALLLVGAQRDGLPFASTTGPGAQHAAVSLSLGAGIVLGFLAQRARFCTMGAFRNLWLTSDRSLLAGVVGVVGAALAANLVFRQAHLTFDITAAGAIGGFLGMVLVGLASTLAGGCPTRQVILAGEGDGDAALFIAGMAVTAAIAHNAALFTSCGEGPIDVSSAALAVIAIGLAACLALAFVMREKS